MSFQLIRSRPAWSFAFTRQRLQPVEPVSPFQGLTPEWAWGGSTGRGVKVAIIDSGIDDSHPGVGGPVSGYATISDGPNGVTCDRTPHEDAYGHGTACASIIRSLAPECELYSVRVLGPTLGGKASHFEAGLRWAVENGMQVCNLSLGTTTRDYAAVLHELADRAYFQNIALITAANNRSTPTFPSVYSSVISVATHDAEDPDRWYYNPRPPVEFGANGTNVRVAWKDGTWITTTGNSYAAAHMTGFVARILGKHPGLTSFHLKSVLWACAANVGGLPPEPDAPATATPGRPDGVAPAAGAGLREPAHTTGTTSEPPVADAGPAGAAHTARAPEAPARPAPARPASRRATPREPDHVR